MKPDISAIRTAASTISKDGATGNLPVVVVVVVLFGFLHFHMIVVIGIINDLI